MNQKVIFRSVFVLAVMVGVAGITGRSGKDAPKPAARARGQNYRELLAGFHTNNETRLLASPASARPMSSYRVNEKGFVGGMEFTGIEYTARASEGGFEFGGLGFFISLGAPRVRQGAVSLECDRGTYSRPAFGEAQIDRGQVLEKDLFENNRAEQTFTLPAPLGAGALQIRIPVTSEIPGPVVAHSPTEPGFKEMQFLKGGLAFCDAAGATKLAYHSAVAIDGNGRELALAPRFEGREIVLEVPAAFMAEAVYPVVVDPWFDLLGSGSGGGITNNGGVSDQPALAMTGLGLVFIAWADNSASPGTTNTDIYMKYWNGFEFKDKDGSSAPGGISKNPGRSTNPSIALEGTGLPTIAWQDDSGKDVNIFLKQLNTFETWVELDGSASGKGVTRVIGPCQHPSVGLVRALAPDVKQLVPIVVYEDLSFSSDIYARIFWPGGPNSELGWYQLYDGGVGTSADLVFPLRSISQTASGVSEFPSLEIDAGGRPVVAWHDTVNGNYEIMVKRMEWGIPNPIGFQVIGKRSSSDIFVGGLPIGAWTGIAGSAGNGGISGTPGASRYPSLALDFASIDPLRIPTFNITVAWQEELPGGAPPGTSFQIYLKRSEGGGAWTELAGSATGLGLSQSTKNATRPSCAYGGRYIGVAWSDDSSTNSEIYARRFFLGSNPIPASTQ